MGANLEITEKLQNYINDFGLTLNPVQQEIIDYNNTLGDIKRMQVDPSQCYFLHLIIKISNIKNVLEIGTFTGLSALSILLALPDDGKLIALDKNEETNKIALNFFKKANQDHKIETKIKPALESLDELKNNKFVDKITGKKINDETMRLLELQKDSMIKFLMKIPKLYYTKSHFPLEISQRAFDHLWRVCESYEMWCKETKQNELITLGILN